MRTNISLWKTLLCLALGLLTPFPVARAQIVVSGPVTPETTMIQNWYAGLPPYLDAEKVIPTRLIGAKDMAGLARHFGMPSLAQGAEYIGMYEYGSHKISLVTGLAPDLLRRCTAHEYGHYVWAEFLHAGDRSRYDDLWTENLIQGHCITPYAHTSAAEGFAEDFSFYMTAPETLKATSPASYAFLEKWMADRAQEKGVS